MSTLTTFSVHVPKNGLLPCDCDLQLYTTNVNPKIVMRKIILEILKIFFKIRILLFNLI